MNRWKISWILAIISIAVFAYARPSKQPLQIEPVWTDYEGDQERFAEMLKILDQKSPNYKSYMTLKDLVDDLKKYGPFELSYIALEGGVITSDDCIDPEPSQHNETIGEMLQRALAPQGLTLDVNRSHILITTRKLTRFNRVYPCPVMDSFQLLSTIKNTIDSEWDNLGGGDTVQIIDTDSQSLVVVSAPFETHREVERLLNRLNRITGIGWRKDAPHWIRIPDQVGAMIQSWIGGATRVSAGPCKVPGSNPFSSGRFRISGGMF